MCIRDRGHIAREVPGLKIPNLKKLGMVNLHPLELSLIHIFAAVLFALTLTGWEVFNRTLGMDVGYDVVVWGYVLIVSIWDIDVYKRQVVMYGVGLLTGLY